MKPRLPVDAAPASVIGVSCDPCAPAGAAVACGCLATSGAPAAAPSGRGCLGIS